MHFPSRFVNWVFHRAAQSKDISAATSESLPKQRPDIKQKAVPNKRTCSAVSRALRSGIVSRALRPSELDRSTFVVGVAWSEAIKKAKAIMNLVKKCMLRQLKLIGIVDRS